MPIQIGSYNFDGPHQNTAMLWNQSGVYAILGSNGNNSWSVVDIGESYDVRTRVENHDRAFCWRSRGYQALTVAAYYVPEWQRLLIERELRAQYQPPCGDR